MKFHYLVSFDLPDVARTESQREAMRRAFGHYLERECAELLSITLAGPGGVRVRPPVPSTDFAVEPLAAGTEIIGPPECEPGPLNRVGALFRRRPQYVVVLIFCLFMLMFYAGFAFGTLTKH